MMRSHTTGGKGLLYNSNLIVSTKDHNDTTISKFADPKLNLFLDPFITSNSDKYQSIMNNNKFVKTVHFNCINICPTHEDLICHAKKKKKLPVLVKGIIRHFGVQKIHEHHGPKFVRQQLRGGNTVLDGVW